MRREWKSVSVPDFSSKRSPMELKTGHSKLFRFLSSNWRTAAFASQHNSDLNKRCDVTGASSRLLADLVGQSSGVLDEIRVHMVEVHAATLQLRAG